VHGAIYVLLQNMPLAALVCGTTAYTSKGCSTLATTLCSGLPASARLPTPFPSALLLQADIKALELACAKRIAYRQKLLGFCVTATQPPLYWLPREVSQESQAALEAAAAAFEDWKAQQLQQLEADKQELMERAAAKQEAAAQHAAAGGRPQEQQQQQEEEEEGEAAAEANGQQQQQQQQGNGAEAGGEDEEMQAAEEAAAAEGEALQQGLAVLW
jgi:hypothetical protein